MSRKLRLTWNAEKGRRGRWRSWYKGHLLQFDGGRGKSDDVAKRAALQALEAKMREIDLQEDRRHEPAYAAALDGWEQALAIALQHADQVWITRAEDKIADLRRRLSETKLQPLSERDFFQNVVFGAPGHEEWLDKLVRQIGLVKPVDGAEPIVQPGRIFDAQIDAKVQAEVWRDRLAQAAKKAAVGDSVQEHVQAFLDSRQAQVASGKLSASRLVSLRVHLRKFQEWIGGTTGAKEIDGPTLIKYKAHVDATCKFRTAGHRLEAAKTLVKWLWATEVIESLPRAFSSGELKIEKSAPEIKTFTLAEVKTLLTRASQRTKLYCLLGLNCGMYQVDICDLKPSEIDLEKGTVTRRRSKTKKHRNPPRVTYNLWPQTLELLKQEITAEGERALIGENGRPLVVQAADGKKTDAVRSAFARLLKKTGLKGSFKLFRKTSASLLADSQWPDVRHLFLGLAAGNIADIHYARAAQGRLAEALAWLGQQYGLIESTPAAVSEQSAAVPVTPSPSPEPVAAEGKPKQDRSRSLRVDRRPKKSP